MRKQRIKKIMVELTVQVSDEVADRLAPIQQRLPELLRQIAQSVPVDRPAESAFPSLTGLPVYTELLDFLVASPSAERIFEFKVSPATQSRLRTLLEKNQEDALTDAEQAELDAYEQVEHVMTLLKAKAHNQLKQQDNGSVQ
jgi:hypothetical protein